MRGLDTDELRRVKNLGRFRDRSALSLIHKLQSGTFPAMARVTREHHYAEAMPNVAG